MPLQATYTLVAQPSAVCSLCVLLQQERASSPIGLEGEESFRRHVSAQAPRLLCVIP